MKTMKFFSTLPLLFVFTMCWSASVKDPKFDKENALKIMEDIKKCYKASKVLQSDPGNEEKTVEFLNACEAFLKEIKVSEMQKAALRRIGYKVEDIFGDRGFHLELNDEKKEEAPVEEKEKKIETVKHKITETLKTKARSSSDGKNQLQKNKLDQQPKTIKVEKPKIETEKFQRPIDTNTEKDQKRKLAPVVSPAQQQEPPHPSSGFDKTQQQNIQPQKPNIQPQKQNIQPQKQNIQPQVQYPPVQDAVLAADNVFNPQNTQHQPVFQQPEQFQAGWPPFDPAAVNQPHLQNVAPHQVQGIPPENIWNQHAGIPQQQQPQQQFLPNQEFFNQPLDGVVFNDILTRARQEMELNQQNPMNNFQANAFAGIPEQHIGAQQQPVAFGGPMQGNFVPQANIPYDGQAWGGRVDYGQVEQQHVQNYEYYPPNDAQNPRKNPQQDLYYGDNFHRKVEL